ncbi:porin [Hyphomicrobium sp.]|uniref:porin n=1 Tax=Hyphomicrobium sp. TaxID=82 RepID=UPI002D78CB0D|nr:porin [Hyphomicrobium sp.]HET6388166.1 porin [Hyphomicrobium sp.]
MKSVFKSSSSFIALMAAIGLAVAITPASAADLGGDCCADLEERVAELEATTARKGNRKVSLTVSGWVNEQVMFWDDGSESNTYVGTNKLEQSRVRFIGEAQIAPGWSAGYTLELGILGANSSGSSGWNQDNPDGTGNNAVSVRKSSWFIKSNDFGKITVGQDGTALYHLLDDADGVNTRNFSDAQAAAVYQGNFGLRHNGGAIGSLTWGGVLQGIDNGTVGQDGRRNVIRYDSPAIAGFTVTASWGEDDDWGMALTYANTWGDFKVLGKAGYGQVSDENIGCSTKTGPTDCELFGAAATIQHLPTGLFVYGGYGQNHDNRVADVGASNTEATSSMYFIQGGIEQKWLALGKTTVFGEYRHDDGGSKNNASIPVGFGGGSLSSTSLNFIGAGVIQNIEPAALDLYVMYRHADGDITSTNDNTVSLDAFDAVIAGALMRF